METTAKTEFSRPLRIKDLKKRVTHLEVEATPAECRALAERFGLPALASLKATVSIERLAKDRAVRIAGTIVAHLNYLSVVSLEPFEADIAEEFSEVLTGAADSGHQVEVDLPPDDENMGLIEDGGFDLGEVISQNLSLLLDEHPRKPGEEEAPDGIVWTDSDAEDEDENPFSVLAEMRDRLRNGD
ncbi:YceD family protein [Nisaea sediminum]|uniref:YceD family protein n=1 Tax=Nisaea sediminum TaxID=2775867 RepID=UPI001865CF86|nr:YceD family protein [Nisaea sediminum]